MNNATVVVSFRGVSLFVDFIVYAFFAFYIFDFYVTFIKGAVSRNSAKLRNYKMPVKLRET